MTFFVAQNRQRLHDSAQGYVGGGASKNEATGQLHRYTEASENAYRIGSPIARELAHHCALYRQTAPAAKH